MHVCKLNCYVHIKIFLYFYLQKKLFRSIIIEHLSSANIKLWIIYIISYQLPTLFSVT